MRPRRETSAETAARFLASRAKAAKLYRRKRTRSDGRWVDGRWQPRRAQAPKQPTASTQPAVPRRIYLDFAEPTLLAIHAALCDAMAPLEHRPIYGGDTLNLIVIAEQMVGRALGFPDCDDPPLTDRIPA